MRDGSESLANVKRNIIHCFTLNHFPKHCIVEGYMRLVKHDFSFVNKCMLTTPNNLLIHHMFGSVFQDYWFHHFPRDQGDADQTTVLHVLLFAFHEGTTFTFLQYSVTSPKYHHLSKRSKSGLAMTSASFTITHEGIPTAPMDLFVFSLSVLWSSSSQCQPSGLQTFPLVPDWDLGFLKVSPTSKYRGAEGIEYLGLFHVPCHQILRVIQ